jgi:ribonuclease D
MPTKRNITREELQALPLRTYSGPVHLPRTREEIYAATQDLHKERVLGFDTETRPSFKKGQHFKPSLVQLAGEHAVYLFQLKRLETLIPLFDLLESPNILKTGVALKRDHEELLHWVSFSPAGFIDLAPAASSAGYEKTGLRNLCGMLLDFRISKKAQVTNWARKELTAEQIRYAATDAWISRDLYFALKARHPECFSSTE